MKTIAAPLALALLAGTALASDLTVRTVVLTGAPAPGLPGLTFDFLSDPRLNAEGEVAFWADVAGAGVTDANNGALWSDRAGAVALILRESDVFAGTLTYGAVPRPNFTGAGQFGLTAALFDTSLPPSQPIRLSLLNELTPGPGFTSLARDGEQATGLPPGINYTGLAPVPMTSGGFRVFTALSGTRLFSGDATLGIGMAASAGTAAPGTSPVLNFGAFFEPVPYAGGLYAFGATLVTPGGSLQPVGQGIWVRSVQFPSPVGLVAVTGGPAHGIAGATYTDLSAHPAAQATVGNQYAVAYWAQVDGGKSTSADDTGLWVIPQGPPPNLVARVREGSTAPGAGPGIFFDSFSRNLSLADIPWSTFAGDTYLAFQATLRGSGVSDLNNSSVWLNRVASNSNTTTLLAREGAQVPRLPAGTFYSSFSDPFVTEAGQVIFLARLQGPAVTPPTSLVLMATEVIAPLATAPAGRVAPIVRAGDAFPVGPGDTRNVAEIYFDSDSPATGYQAHDADGSFMFKLVFKDAIVPTPPPPTFPFRFTEGLFVATTRCLTDINGDGALNLADFGAFQTAFALGDLRKADSNGDGILNLADFGAFQTAFALGCP